MTDAHDQKQGRSGTKPPSAHPLTVGSDAPLGVGQARESGKPTPVRDLATHCVSSGDTANVETDVGEATVEVHGTSWTVRVLGRSGGTSAVKTPLLLLGLWKAQAATSPPDREALVVGETPRGHDCG